MRHFFALLLCLSFLVPIWGKAGYDMRNGKDVVYNVSEVCDLKGKTLRLKNNTILRIKKGAVIKNGIISGDGIFIEAQQNSRVFSNIKLQGSFSNEEAYLSWWQLRKDITSEVKSLVSVFNGRIFLDKGGVLSERINIRNKENVDIDGCNNSFHVEEFSGNLFSITNNKQVCLRNINVVFDDGFSVSNPSKEIRVFHIDHTEGSQVYLAGISISGFSNLKSSPCSFMGIVVSNCTEKTVTNITDVKISRIYVKGDGNEVTGPGCNYGILLSCKSDVAGKIEVSHCSFSSMFNLNEKGEYVYEDTSGIYFSGISIIDGRRFYTSWRNAILHDCSFLDISKRNVKVQGNDMTIINLRSDCTDSFLQTSKNMFVGAEGDNLRCSGLTGRYDGSVVKITGNHLLAENIDCSSEVHSADGHLRTITLECCYDAVIKNVKFNNPNYIFVYPTEGIVPDGVTPRYSISDCDINVKNVVYCNSSQKTIYNNGIFLIDRSSITLHESFCYNKSGFADISIKGSQIKMESGVFMSASKSRCPRLSMVKSKVIIGKGVSSTSSLFCGLLDVSDSEIEIDKGAEVYSVFTAMKDSKFNRISYKNSSRARNIIKKHDKDVRIIRKRVKAN